MVSLGLVSRCKNLERVLCLSALSMKPRLVSTMFKLKQKQTCMFKETHDPIVLQKRNAYEKNIPLYCVFLIVMHACYVGVL